MKVLRALTLAAVLPFAGCITAFPPSTGNVTDISTVDLAALDQMQRGESCATTILGLFTTGDAMVTTAAREAGITMVRLVEYEARANPLFHKQCVTVYGR